MSFSRIAAAVVPWYRKTGAGDFWHRIFGLLSYAVSQCTAEIGVRLALGAERADVVKLIVGHGFALAVSGVAIGSLAAVALTRLISTWLFAVSPTDALTFSGVALTMLVVAVLACAVPAYRASGVDPMIALRAE